MNKLHLLVMVTGLGLLLGVTPSWGATPVCASPGCNPTASDLYYNTAGGYNALIDNKPDTSHQTNDGNFNTAFGDNALASNNTGQSNTASGFQALLYNITGNNNTASGVAALVSNISGSYNTADGASALFANSSGSNNTASGYSALGGNNGSNNTASGYDALTTNNGSYNTASGASALLKNGTGNLNTADGFSALHSNTGGYYNTALGGNALYKSNANYNTAIGAQALYYNTTGYENTASGVNALVSNTTGSNNIALGYNAGTNVTTASYDIYIGHAGYVAEGHTIRIGTQGTFQTQAFIAGISGTNIPTGGTDVVVNSSGKLGVVVSSARFKRDIRDMGQASGKLMSLRPVTFRYKEDSTGTIQYGLVAEEVARVYPELVTYGADGKIETVRYSMLTGMLLNELQKQTRENARQAAQIAELKAARDRDRAQRAAFEARLSALEQTTQARNGGHKLAVAFGR